MAESPAFSFYAKDFLVGTIAFSLAERGAYITLLAYQWDCGSVPDDVVARARILGCSLRESERVWLRVADKFTKSQDGAWRNDRLEMERRKQEARRAALTANGSKGGRPKRAPDNQTQSNRFPVALASDNQNESLSSSSSSSEVLPQRSAGELAHTRDGDLPKRAGEFCQWYEDTHERLFKVGYIGTRNDYEAALRLVRKFSDGDLRDGALVWFGQDDDFASKGTRTIPKFASRASHCIELARKVAS